jgi:hypothetical protein
VSTKTGEDVTDVPNVVLPREPYPELVVHTVVEILIECFGLHDLTSEEGGRLSDKDSISEFLPVELRSHIDLSHSGAAIHVRQISVDYVRSGTVKPLFDPRQHRRIEIHVVGI